MGTSEFAVDVLRRLADTPHRPMLVVTRPDRPRGRGRKVQAPPVAEAARELGIEVFQPASVNDEAPKLNGIGALIEESNVLRHILHDAFHRMKRLGGALKRHRQQSRTVHAALTSLKALQRIDA